MNANLVVFREDGTRRDFPLGYGSTSIGRASGCTVRIPLAVVSRQHAEIAISEPGDDTGGSRRAGTSGTRAVLKDLGGSNGTFLNNRRIAGEVELKPGDQIMVGPVIFTVQIDGKPTDDEIFNMGLDRLKTRPTGSAEHAATGGTARVGTSKHVYTSDDEIDPIAALEALASSADQTVIHSDEEEDE